MPVAKGRKTVAKPRRLSHTRQPGDLSTPDWQLALRRQYGREQAFTLENLGDAAVFSEFAVHNPASGNSCRVAIRGAGLGDNYCACPDFATNPLGTCKHIEFVLGKLERRRGGKAALRRGFEADYSELFLRYGAGHARAARAAETVAVSVPKRRRAVCRARRSGAHRR